MDTKTHDELLDELTDLRRQVAELRAAQNNHHGVKDELAEAKFFTEELLAACDMIVVGLDRDGNVTSFSRAAEEVTGYSRDEIIGRNPLATIIPPDRLPRAWRQFRPTLAGAATPNPIEIPIITKSGQHRLVSLRAVTLRREGTIAGTVVFGFDITDHNRVEHQAARLAAIVQSSQDAIIGSTPDGIITSWNHAAERLFGYTADEAIGRSLAMIQPPGFEVEWPANNEKLARGEKIEPYQTVRRRKDGSLIDIQISVSLVRDSSGRIVGASGIMHDITCLKNVERERERLVHELEKVAERAERRAAELQSVLDTMVDAVYVVDAAGTLILANQAAHDIATKAGQPRPEVPAGPSPYTIDPRASDETPVPLDYQPLARALRGETITNMDTVLHNRETRCVIYTRTNAAPIHDDNGTIVGAVAVARDITPFAELDHLKEQFVSVTAHELKTPIAIIKGYAQALLRSQESCTASQQRMLIAINRGADRIDRIVGDLMDVSRLQLGQLSMSFERIDLVDFVDSVVDRLRPISPRHQLHFTYNQRVSVDGDPLRLDQALTHLISNAITYSPEGGDVEISLTARSDSMVITVRDHGIGIPVTRQGHIFERFYRAHAGTPYDFAGMGVGLYIAREIVALHGGRMWFESWEGQGSSFSFTLPLRSLDNA